MAANYDNTIVGNPFVRVNQIVINYPDGNLSPSATIYQTLAVKLVDGTARALQELSPINVTFDLAGHGNDPIQMVDLNTGADLVGQTTTLNQVLLSILAVVRQQQLLQSP